MYLHECRECNRLGAVIPNVPRSIQIAPTQRGWRDAMSDAILIASFASLLYSWWRGK